MSTTTTATTTTLAPVAPAEAGTKRDWHATTTLEVRRRLLLQILLLLKTKYGKVDAKISYIARRAELALYTQAFSVVEYRNPKTLNRRLHSLVVKLHMNNLAAREDQIFGVEATAENATANTTDAAPGIQRKRARPDESASMGLSPAVVATAKRRRPTESPLFFNGNADLLHHVCTFLSAHDTLELAATTAAAYRLVPTFITSIRVSAQTLETLSPAARTCFFDRFVNLACFEVLGDARSHLHFDFQNELALVRRNVVCRSLLVALARQPLPQLQRVRWHYAFVDGIHDRITSQIAEVLLDASKFPKLEELSLVGNAVSDDGVSYLCQALHACGRSMCVLNLEQNFVGERGQLQLERLVKSEQLCGANPLVVKLSGNLLAAPAPR